jgi:hypothetical protein
MARRWTFALDGTDHVVAVRPNSWWKGWPSAFTCDGREYKIHIAFRLGRRFEFPCSVGSHPAVLVMSRAAPPPFWTRFKVALGAAWRGRSLAGREAVNALTPWQYELLVDGRSVEPDTGRSA